MAGEKISQLPSLDKLTGVEKIPVASGGSNYAVAVDKLIEFVPNDVYLLPGYLLGWFDKYRPKEGSASNPRTVQEINDLVGSYTDFLAVVKKNALFACRVKDYNTVVTSYVVVNVQSYGVKPGAEDDAPYFTISAIIYNINGDIYEQLSVTLEPNSAKTDWNPGSTYIYPRSTVLRTSEIVNSIAGGAVDQVLSAAIGRQYYDLCRLAQGQLITIKSDLTVEYPDQVNDALLNSMNIMSNPNLILSKVGIKKSPFCIPVPYLIQLIQSDTQIYQCVYKGEPDYPNYTLDFEYKIVGDKYTLVVGDSLQQITTS